MSRVAAAQFGESHLIMVTGIVHDENAQERGQEGQSNSLDLGDPISTENGTH